MRSVQTLGSTQDQRPWTSPACLAFAGTAARSSSSGLAVNASTFLVPFAPRPLRRFPATMEPLTPRQVSRSTEVSPLHVTRPFVTIPPPNTPAPPSPLSHATPQLDGFPSQVQASPLASRLAGVVRPNRVRLLRTGASPPVALHPASRRRSYLRLQAGERMPEEDLHLSERVRSRAHQPRAPPWVCDRRPPGAA